MVKRGNGSKHNYNTCPLLIIGQREVTIITSWNTSFSSLSKHKEGGTRNRAVATKNPTWANALKEAKERLEEHSLEKYHIQSTDILPKLGAIERLLDINPFSSSSNGIQIENPLVPYVFKLNGNGFNLYQALSFIFFGKEYYLYQEA